LSIFTFVLFEELYNNDCTFAVDECALALVCACVHMSGLMRQCVVFSVVCGVIEPFCLVKETDSNLLTCYVKRLTVTI